MIHMSGLLLAVRLHGSLAFANKMLLFVWMLETIAGDWTRIRIGGLSAPANGPHRHAGRPAFRNPFHGIYSDPLIPVNQSSFT